MITHKKFIYYLGLAFISLGFALPQYAWCENRCEPLLELEAGVQAKVAGALKAQSLTQPEIIDRLNLQYAKHILESSKVLAKERVLTLAASWKAALQKLGSLGVVSLEFRFSAAGGVITNENLLEMGDKDHRAIAEVANKFFNQIIYKQQSETIQKIQELVEGTKNAKEMDNAQLRAVLEQISALVRNFAEYLQNNFTLELPADLTEQYATLCLKNPLDKILDTKRTYDNATLTMGKINSRAKNAATEANQRAQAVKKQKEAEPEVKKPKDFITEEEARIMEAANLASLEARQFLESDGVKKLLSLHAALEAIKEAQEYFGNILNNPTPVGAKLNESTGRVEIHFPELCATVSYIPEIGTAILHSDQGLFPNPNGPVVILAHGDGSDKSNSASWAASIAKFVASGLNPIAFDFPFAGMGPKIEGVHEVAVFMELAFDWIKKQREASTLPVIFIGRSSGGPKGLAHAMLSGGQNNFIDLYFFISFSNPNTIDKQMKHVRAQAERGEITLDEEALKYVYALEKRLKEQLEAEKTRDPKKFDGFGSNIVCVQGDADEDGGLKDAVPELVTFLEAYAPKALVYPLLNPLFNYPSLPSNVATSEDKVEASHFAISAKNNMTPEEGKRLLPGVPACDLPALQNQYFEIMALLYGTLDRLIEQGNEKLGASRKQLCGDKTYLEWFANNSRNNPERQEDLMKGIEREFPSRTLRGRLARVMEFLKK